MHDALCSMQDFMTCEDNDHNSQRFKWIKVGMNWSSINYSNELLFKLITFLNTESFIIWIKLPLGNFDTFMCNFNFQHALCHSFGYLKNPVIHGHQQKKTFLVQGEREREREREIELSMDLFVIFLLLTHCEEEIFAGTPNTAWSPATEDVRCTPDTSGGTSCLATLGPVRTRAPRRQPRNRFHGSPDRI